MMVQNVSSFKYLKHIHRNLRQKRELNESLRAQKWENISVIFSSISLSSLNCCIYSCLFQECKQHCSTNRALSICRAEQAKQEVGAGKLSWQAWHKWPENTGKGFGGTFLIIGNNVKFNVCEKFLGVTAGTNNCTEKRRDRSQSVKKGICRCYIFLSIWSKYKENTQFRRTNKPSIKTDIFFFTFYVHCR